MTKCVHELCICKRKKKIGHTIESTKLSHRITSDTTWPSCWEFGLSLLLYPFLFSNHYCSSIRHCWKFVFLFRTFITNHKGCWQINLLKNHNLFPLRISFHSIHIVCLWLPAWFLNREGIYSSIRQILLRLSYVPDNVLCISLSLCWVFCTVLPGNCVHSMGSIFPERPVFSTCSIDGSPFIRGKNHFQPRVYDENRMSHFPKTLTAWHVQCIPLNKLLETLSNVNYYFFISKRHLS